MRTTTVHEPVKLLLYRGFNACDAFRQVFHFVLGFCNAWARMPGHAVTG